MTTHDRDKIIAAAKEAGCHHATEDDKGMRHWRCTNADMERLYAIAFEDGRALEREEIAISLTPYDKPNKTEVQRMADVIAVELVEAIRARGDMK